MEEIISLTSNHTTPNPQFNHNIGPLHTLNLKPTGLANQLCGSLPEDLGGSHQEAPQGQRSDSSPRLSSGSLLESYISEESKVLRT